MPVEMSSPLMWGAMSSAESSAESARERAPPHIHVPPDADAGFVGWDRMDALMASYEYRAVCGV